MLLAPPSLVRSLVGTLPRFASQATQSTLRIGDAGQQTGMLPWKLTNSMRVKPAMCYRYHRSCKHYVVSSKRKKAGGNVQGSLEGSSISSHVPWPMSTSSSQSKAIRIRTAKYDVVTNSVRRPDTHFSFSKLSLSVCGAELFVF